jgi:purine nucleosidase
MRNFVGLLASLFVVFPLVACAKESRLEPADRPALLIFDTDMGNDIDDALALGLIHALQSQGECKLLAVTVTKDNPYAAPFVDVINTFYGRGETPLGAVRGGVTPDDGKYLRALCTATDDRRPRYPHKFQDGRDLPEATGVLRRVLAAQPDSSVVVVQVGFSTNMARLLDSKPDEVSPLDGMALVSKKVRLLSAMAGCFASKPGREGSAKDYREYNVVMDVKSAQELFHRWPTPVMFSGFEIGEAICYPSRSIEQDYSFVAHHPLAEAYRLYAKMPCDRPMWDLTSVLYAVRPDAGYFGLSSPGRVTVTNEGVTQFQSETNGPHRYLTVSAEQAKKVQKVFTDYCSRPPDRGPREAK